MKAEHLMLVGGVGAFLLTLSWVRARQLREKYAVAWMFVATGLLLMGLFPSLIMKFADAMHMAYASAVLFLALAVIYVFSMSVSLSLTRARRSNVRLAQELALTRFEIEELRRELAGNLGANRTVAETTPSPQ